MEVDVLKKSTEKEVDKLNDKVAKLKEEKKENEEIMDKMEEEKKNMQAEIESCEKLVSFSNDYIGSYKFSILCNISIKILLFI